MTKNDMINESLKTGYIILILLIYGQAKKKQDKFLAHTCTNKEKKIEKKEDSLA